MRAVRPLLPRLPAVDAPLLLALGTLMLAAGLAFALIALLRGEGDALLLRDASARSAWALAYLVGFGSLAAFSAYVYLLARRVRPALATSYAFVNPGVAVLLGALFASERLGPFGALGLTVVTVGVALALLGRPRAR